MAHHPAPEVAAVAAELIPAHHVDLIGAPIVYVFVSPTPKSRGRLVLGRARRVSGLSAFLVALSAGEVESSPFDDDEDLPDYSFFVMEVAWREWVVSTAEHRAALVDHELCHFVVDEEGKLSLRGHDLEEFNAVVARHGLWREDVELFAGVCTVAE